MSSPGKLDETIRTGGCQCGAVRFRATGLRDNPHLCHCRMCQKAYGNFFAALVGVFWDDFSWTRGEPANFESSQGIKRGFCGKCGTPLYFLRDGSKHISISIGAFDDPASIPLAFELGIESRLPQLNTINALENFGSSEDDDPEGTALAKSTSRQHPDHD